MPTILHPFAAGLFPDLDLQADISLSTGGLSLSFCLRGDLSLLVLPEPATGFRRDSLWQSTCWECFLAREDSPEYFEINLSPSHHWNVYHFTDYRQGMNAPPLPPPVIRSWREDGLYRLDALVAGLPIVDDKASWRLGLSAVLAGQDGTKAYLALAHPGDKPDFHHPKGFVLGLTCGEQSCV